jgi:hypothetical protein
LLLVDSSTCEFLQQPSQLSQLIEVVQLEMLGGPLLLNFCEFGSEFLEFDSGFVGLFGVWLEGRGSWELAGVSGVIRSSSHFGL